MSSSYCIQQVTIPVGCPICPGSYPDYGTPGTPVLHIKNWTDPCGTGLDGYLRFWEPSVNPAICGFSTSDTYIVDPFHIYITAGLNTTTNMHQLLCFNGDFSVVYFFAQASNVSNSFCGVQMDSPDYGCGALSFELEMVIPP